MPTVDADAAKRALRERLLAGRRARSAELRTEARARIAEHLRAALAGVDGVAAYLPLPTEPLDPDLLAWLHAAGSAVLLPVVTGAAPLDWVRYPSPTAPGALGLSVPTGPRLGPRALSGVEVVLVPALAVDGHGYRLGRGGGHYDRTLAAVAGPRRIALIYDDELVDEVPRDTFDQPVHAVARPSGVLTLV